MEPSEHRNVIPVDNETSSCATRFSKEGRQYKYCMNVIQQPVRARACGAGAKCQSIPLPSTPDTNSQQHQQTDGLSTRHQL